MKLRKLRIEHFKRFREPLVIDGFADGLNLFAAPNESGKSTVAEAIRAAFFERHRSGSVEHLRPWGDSSATPTSLPRTSTVMILQTKWRKLSQLPVNRN